MLLLKRPRCTWLRYWYLTDPLLSWPRILAVMLAGVVAERARLIAAWSLAAVYAAGLALLCQRPGWVTRLDWLRATGRMAFTNYAMQALLIVPLCLALGLFDRVTPTLGVLLALGVAAVEIPVSVWWLRHHRYDPLEWLWRTVTYGGRPRPEPGLLA